MELVINVQFGVILFCLCVAVLWRRMMNSVLFLHIGYSAYFHIHLYCMFTHHHSCIEVSFWLTSFFFLPPRLSFCPTRHLLSLLPRLSLPPPPTLSIYLLCLSLSLCVEPRQDKLCLPHHILEEKGMIKVSMTVQALVDETSTKQALFTWEGRRPLSLGFILSKWRTQLPLYLLK